MPAVSRGRISIIVTCAALGLAIAGCGGSSDSSTQAGAEATSTAKAPSSEDINTKPEVTVPDGPPPKQLEIKELVEGTGAEAKPGLESTVQYVGVDYKTGKQFDASWDRGEPFTFKIGDREVIPGWDQGVKGMKVGGRRELIIPPNLAYGATGAPPAIAPNETLIFVIDLVSVK
jgi:peptidylprolyl isomerase